MVEWQIAGGVDDGRCLGLHSNNSSSQVSGYHRRTFQFYAYSKRQCDIGKGKRQKKETGKGEKEEEDNIFCIQAKKQSGRLRLSHSCSLLRPTE